MKKFLIILLVVINASVCANDSDTTACSYDGSSQFENDNPGIEKEIPVCLRWGEREQCGFKTACKYTCVFASGAAGALAGKWWAAGTVAVGGQICGDLCENVNECRMVKYCEQWSM
ncbi:MAG: hypothetical protein HQK53_12720 [Oligoflexia bacterium]|nr:hypothetical protein [Oligoflexia bacterium]